MLFNILWIYPKSENHNLVLKEATCIVKEYSSMLQFILFTRPPAIRIRNGSYASRSTPCLIPPPPLAIIFIVSHSFCRIFARFCRSTDVFSPRNRIICLSQSKSWRKAACALYSTYTVIPIPFYLLHAASLVRCGNWSLLSNLLKSQRIQWGRVK